MLDSETPMIGSIELTSGAGAVLTDGSAVPEVFGGQGGTHWSFALTLEGTGLGRCVDVLVEARVDGTLVESYDGTVTTTGTDRLARTSEIVVFGPRSFGVGRCVEVTASAFGQGTIVRRLTQSDPAACNRPPDAGMPDAGPPPECGNGRVESGEACDEPDPARCTLICERPRCGDGIPSPGEACFEATGAIAASPSPILQLAELEGPIVVGVTATSLVRHAAGSLAAVGEPIALAAPPRALAAGDLDGDGASDDVAVVDATTLHVWLGDAGTLGAPTSTALASEPLALLATNLDADPADELVLALASDEVHVLDATAIDLGAPVLSELTGLVTVAAFRSATGFDVLAVARGAEVQLHTRAGDAPFVVVETFPRGSGTRLAPLAEIMATVVFVEAGEAGLVVHERTADGWIANAVDAFGPVTGLSFVPRDATSVLLAASPYVSRAFAVSPSRPQLPYWLPLDGGSPTYAALGLSDGTIALSREDGLVALAPSE
jgi:hypothetical protein